MRPGQVRLVFSVFVKVCGVAEGHHMAHAHELIAFTTAKALDKVDVIGHALHVEVTGGHIAIHYLIVGDILG